MADAPAELASGKLLLDEPAPGAVRLAIHNPERRGALDHELLDTLAETVAGLDARCLVITGSEGVFSAGYDIGSLEGRSFEKSAEKLVAHPFHEAIAALDAYPYPVVGGAQTATRSAVVWSWRSPATSGSRRVGSRWACPLPSWG